MNSPFETRTAFGLISVPTFIAAGFFSLSSHAQESSIDRLFRCGSVNFRKVNSQSVIESRFVRNGREAELQNVVTGTVRADAVQNSSEFASQRGADIRWSRKLLDFSLNSGVAAADAAVGASESDLRSSAFNHALLLNSDLQELFELAIEKDALDKQIVELQELDRFAGNLVSSRVIDPADSLLIQENLNRFRLRRVEVEQLQTQAKRAFESALGFSVSGLERVLASELEKDVPSTSVWDRIETSIEALPSREAARLRLQELELEKRAIDRSWYPILSGELAATQPATGDGPLAVQPQVSAGLAISFSWRDRTMDAGRERIRALTELETERARRADIELRSLVQSGRESWKLMKTQQSIVAERKENLERLNRLQLVKFRSGKLSFLNLNDVMLSALEVRRQVSSIRMRMNKLERDGQMVLRFSRTKVENTNGCP